MNEGIEIDSWDLGDGARLVRLSLDGVSELAMLDEPRARFRQALVIRRPGRDDQTLLRDFATCSQVANFASGVRAVFRSGQKTADLDQLEALRSALEGATAVLIAVPGSVARLDPETVDSVRDVLQGRGTIVPSATVDEMVRKLVGDHHRTGQARRELAQKLLDVARELPMPPRGESLAGVAKRVMEERAKLRDELASTREERDWLIGRADYLSNERLADAAAMREVTEGLGVKAGESPLSAVRRHLGQVQKLRDELTEAQESASAASVDHAIQLRGRDTQSLSGAVHAGPGGPRLDGAVVEPTEPKEPTPPDGYHFRMDRVGDVLVTTWRDGQRWDGWCVRGRVNGSPRWEGHEQARAWAERMQQQTKGLVDLSREIRVALTDETCFDSSNRFHSLLVRTRWACELHDHDVSVALPVDVPTARRWLTGESCPAPKMRRMVYRYLQAQIERTLTNWSER